METAARPQELLGRWSTILIKTILVLIKYIILIYFIRKGHCFSQSKKVFGKENKSEPRKFGIEFIEFMVSGIELIEFMVMVSTKTSEILVITLGK